MLNGDLIIITYWACGGLVLVQTSLIETCKRLLYEVIDGEDGELLLHTGPLLLSL